jgi:hypothetical protein
MNRVIRIFFLAVMTVCFSCEDKGWFADCSDCTSSEPRMTTLVVKLKDIDAPVYVNIYEGELEDSVLYDFTEFFGTEYTPMVNLNKRYTITATYHIDGNIYTAIDSATPKVKFTEDQCEEACYYVYDKVVDLRLKYTAKGN